MKNIFTNTFAFIFVSIGLTLVSGCADDPLFNPNPSYAWNPGNPYADSVSYLGKDSVTLYGHFKPKAFVVDVKDYFFEVFEVDLAGITQKTDSYLILKNVRWEFSPYTVNDTLIVSRINITSLKPKPGIRASFRLSISIIKPPSEPGQATRDLKSNSIAIEPTGTN
jgi:hypothetical protein